jgi:hypothetical protein
LAIVVKPAIPSFLPMPPSHRTYDVFISHSTKDFAVAENIKRYLSAAGINCWKAPDDILPGESWPSAITRALGECSAIVLVWSAHSVTSPEVSKELTLATRNGLTIIPFRVENAQPTPEWSYHLANTHWMDAFPGPAEKFFPDLLTRIASLLGAASGAGVLPHPPSEKTGTGVLVRRALAVLAIVALIGLAGLLFGMWKGFELFRKHETNAAGLDSSKSALKSNSLAVSSPEGLENLAVANSSDTNLSVPPWQLSEPLSPPVPLVASFLAEPLAPADAMAAPKVDLAEVASGDDIAKKNRPPVEKKQETIDGTYRGEFVNLSSGRVRDFTISITSQDPTSVGAPVADIGATVTFGDEVDDGLRGTVIYAEKVSFSVGWDNSTGNMRFVGNAEDRKIEGTWELRPNQGEGANGTFQALRVVE